jgi:GDP-mannose 6-dehydrogenase
LRLSASETSSRNEPESGQGRQMLKNTAQVMWEAPQSEAASQAKQFPSISVIGLGYVGAVSAACFSKIGHRVVGVDLDTRKTDAINAGKGPLVEHDLDDYIADGVQEGRITAVNSSLGAIVATDMTFVCVGTPSEADGSVNLNALMGAARDIGMAIKAKRDWHLVVIRSTIPAGTTRTALLPEIERVSGLKAGQDFGLCFHPEFLREGVAIADFFAPPKTVIGEFDKRSGDALAAIYASIEAPLIRTSIEAAEMVKYVDNTWHAVKVAFGNEVGRVAQALGIDSHEVMNIFCQDTKLNISTYYLKPGFAFGGSCLPKDLRGMTGLARKNGIELPMIGSVIESNHSHLEHSFNLVKATGAKTVGILGVTFKSGTDDLRESPQLELIGRLVTAGYKVKIYDPNVTAAGIELAMAYMKTASETTRAAVQALPQALCISAKALVNSCDAVVVAHNTAEFRTALEAVSPSLPVVDLVRLPEKVRNRANYKGICW